MLFVVQNYNVHFNANGMKIMEQRCHNSPLTTCGTNNTTKTTTTSKELQRQQQQYDCESWQVLDNYNNSNQFVLKQIIVNVDNFNTNRYNARDDNCASFLVKNPKLSLRHRSLLKNKLKNHRYSNHKTPRLHCWHHITDI